jgi:hypothetical protein
MNEFYLIVQFLKRASIYWRMNQHSIVLNGSTARVSLLLPNTYLVN